MGLGAKLPSGRPFEKGHRKTGGRRAGVPNKYTRAVKDFLRELVDDPEVQDAIRDQIVSGKRGSAQLFLGAVAHVLGRPREKVEVETTPSMGKLLVMALQASNEMERQEREKAATEVSAGQPLSRPA